MSGPHFVRSMVKFRWWFLYYYVIIGFATSIHQDKSLMLCPLPSFIHPTLTLSEISVLCMNYIVERNIYPGISYKVFLWLWIQSFQLIRIDFLGINLFPLKDTLKNPKHKNASGTILQRFPSIMFRSPFHVVSVPNLRTVDFLQDLGPTWKHSSININRS